MSMIKELELLNKEIKDAEREMTLAEGEKKARIDRLKKEFGISPDQVESTLKKLSSQIEDGMVTIVEKFEKLKEEYEW